MHDLLATYLPQDRRRALAAGIALPADTSGVALLADLAGFTAYAAALVAQHGPRHGAEQLTHQLDSIYAALIGPVEAWGGSVLGFAGDAITCWFDAADRPPAPSAAACALALQRALLALETPALRLKVVLVAGACRRLLLGDPHIQQLDLLTGPLLTRLADAEHAVRPGEVLLDAASAAALGAAAQLGPGRPDAAGRPLRQLLALAPAPLPTIVPLPTPPPALTTPYLPASLATRLLSGAGEFTAELRPVVLLFVRLNGLDLATDAAAEERLAAAVRWLQQVLAQHAGTLVQLTIGDKGSYAYAAFGAPLLHEDDPARAAAAALTLLAPPASLRLGAPAIGISRGLMRTGAYGSQTRRTYGVLGSEANLAARLMQRADPGQIIISGAVAAALPPSFARTPLGAHPIKGLPAPLPLFHLTGRANAGPAADGRAMQGRIRERALLAERLVALRAGSGGAVGIEGEPGIGKSRLLHELLELARATGVQVLSGWAEAVEQSTPYFAWRPVVSALVADAPADALPAWFTADPWLAERAALLNPLLGKSLPESALTGQLSGQSRAETTNALLIRLLDRAASHAPLLVTLEDVHWLDTASWALAALVPQQLPALLLTVTTRPTVPSAEAGRFWGQPEVQLLPLDPLTGAATAALIADALQAETVASDLAALITARAEGNPFFAIQLALTLRDVGAVQTGSGAARLTPGVDPATLDLPTTIQGAVTSRIDRLPPAEQLALKIASVIGREFTLETLAAIHPATVDRDLLQQTLGALERQQIADRTADAAPRYLFRHVIIQQAAYDLLLTSQRQALHRAVAAWYEQTLAADLAPHYGLLAHHWHQAADADKARRYLQLAGAQALRLGSYREAIGLLTAALAPAAARSRGTALERATVQRQLGAAYFGLGNLPQARTQIEGALALLGASMYAHRPAHVLGLALRDVLGWVWRTNTPSLPITPVELELGRCYWQVSNIYAYESANLAALHAGLRALRLLGRAAVPAPDRVSAFASSGLIAANLAVPWLARRGFRAAHRTAVQSGDQSALVYTCWIDGMASAGWAAWGRAEQRFSQAAAAAAGLNDWRLLGEVLNFWQLARLHSGDVSGSMAVNARLRALTERTENAIHKVWGENTYAWISLRHGQTAAALALFQRAEHDLGTLAIGGGTHCVIRDGLVQCHLRAGQLDAARLAVVDLDRRISRPITITYIEHQGYGALADVALALYADAPRSAALRRQAERAVAELRRCARTYPMAAARAELAAAQLAWLSGARPAAARAWAAALQRASAHRMPYEQGLAHLALARLGGPARRTHLHSAVRLFQQVGAAYEIGLAVAADR